MGVSTATFRGLRGGRLTPEAFLRRQRRRSRWGAWGLVAVLTAVFLADRRGLFVYGGADATRYDGRSFGVVAVIDGQTLDLDVSDGPASTTRVRLWGIKTPGAARPGAQAATQRITELALGQRVTVRLEPHRPRDGYGRLLVYAVLPDGTVFNERLLGDGLAEADDRWPHRDMDRYARLQDQAQRERRGLWAEYEDEP